MIEVKQPILTMDQVRIEKDISGGVRLIFGDKIFVLNKDHVIRLCSAMLKMSGVSIFQLRH